MMEGLSKTDPVIAEAIRHEVERTRGGLELIPSENFPSLAVLQALGSVFNNKYSEGYPRRRYYGGNEYMDVGEGTAIERARKLFGVGHANVQPYSGSPANQAALFAVCEPGDKVMGMNLLFGGHLTHGWKVNFSARYYHSVQYQTGPDGILDYDEIERLVRKERPRALFCGATSYPRLYDYRRLGEIARSVDGFFIADIAHEAGLIAGKAIPGPTGHADLITTTTHKTLRGPRGGMILCDGEPSNPLSPLPEGADIRNHLPTLVDRAVFPGLQGGPHNHTTAAIAVALGEAMKPAFRGYAKQVIRNARALAQELMDRGYRLTTGGTENHLMIIDLSGNGIGGKKAETALDRAGITCNKNVVPFDRRKPWDPSGVRVGTPAVTSRGMKESEMRIIGELIARVLDDVDSKDVRGKVREEVRELGEEFPLYPGLDHGFLSAA